MGSGSGSDVCSRQGWGGGNETITTAVNCNPNLCHNTQGHQAATEKLRAASSAALSKGRAEPALPKERHSNIPCSSCLMPEQHGNSQI